MLSDDLQSHIDKVIMNARDTKITIYLSCSEMETMYHDTIDYLRDNNYVFVEERMILCNAVALEFMRN